MRELPGLVEHLLDVAGQVGSSSAGGGGVHTPPGPGMLWPQALSAADELHSLLASWCEEISQECPAASAPPATGSRWTTSRTLVDPDTGESYTSGPAVIGLRDASASLALCGWLEPHLEWVAAQEWAGIMVDELASAVSTTAARWPVVDRDRRVRDVRCPSCGALSLVVHPPLMFGLPLQVSCSRLECGLVLGEDDWDQTRAQAVAIAQAIAKAKEAAHEVA